MFVERSPGCFFWFVWKKRNWRTFRLWGSPPWNFHSFWDPFFLSQTDRSYGLVNTALCDDCAVSIWFLHDKKVMLILNTVWLLIACISSHLHVGNGCFGANALFNYSWGIDSGGKEWGRVVVGLGFESLYVFRVFVCGRDISTCFLFHLFNWKRVNKAFNYCELFKYYRIHYFIFFLYVLLMFNSYLSCDYFCLPFSINTVYYMAPFATMILAVPAMVLEGPGVIDWFQTHESIGPALIIIFSSGVLAFCLNFSIFYVIHSTTAVTFNVAGNLKVSSLK